MGRGRTSGKRRGVALVRAGMVLGIGGFMLVGGATAAPQASMALQVAMHPSDPAATPGDGGASSASLWASSNWSGYAITTTSSAPFTAITANWTVPTASPTHTASYSAAWTGIDGFFGDPAAALIQTGTEQDYFNGRAHYNAWWTTSNNGYFEQSFTGGLDLVAPGDPMTATITEDPTTASTWTITLIDHSSTNGWTDSQTITGYTAPRYSAEWIMEAPTVGGRIASLAQYSTFPFDSGTVNGNPVILAANNGGEMIQHNRVVSIPSAPDTPNADGFAMAYGSVAPPAPNNS